MNKVLREQLRIAHTLTCDTCGRLDTPAKWIRCILAQKGTTPEKRREEVDKMVELVVPILKQYTREVNIKTAIALGLPLRDEELR